MAVVPASRIHQIAFPGDYLSRKCGIATFTSDLLSGAGREYPESQCFSVPVNDIPGGCLDARHVDRVNQDQGAESTLAFLLSVAEMKPTQHAATVLHPHLPPKLELSIGRAPALNGAGRGVPVGHADAGNLR